MFQLFTQTAGDKVTIQDILAGIVAINSKISFLDIIIVLAVSLALGAIIYIAYRISYKGVVYSQVFNASLVFLPMIISVLILAVSSNVTLSLGMVGALSIVRFRTAIKDPMDLVFLFFSIAIGIITGAKLYVAALVATILISIAIIFIVKIPGKKPVYLMIIRYNTEVQQEVGRALSKLDGKVRNRNAAAGVSEITIELTLPGGNANFVDRIADIEGVHSCNLVSYSGDFVE